MAKLNGRNCYRGRLIWLVKLAVLGHLVNVLSHQLAKNCFQWVERSLNVRENRKKPNKVREYIGGS
jgi:hypothetical protein